MQNSDPIHSGTSPYQHELLILLEAIKVASAKCEEIRIHGRQQTTIKADGSPVTRIIFNLRLSHSLKLFENRGRPCCSTNHSKGNYDAFP